MTTVTKSAPAGLAFRWPWRDYQARVLDQLDAHLSDRRLHVVAAPGSGKTVLGLEIVRRLGRPALILSPTRTVRDQWIARLADFLPPDADGLPAWVSSSLEDPGFLTSVTYQALRVAAKASAEAGMATEWPDAAERPEEESGEEDTDLDFEPPSDTEVESHCDNLRRAGVKILVLDEAHHLRNAWWTTLSRLVARLPDLTVISLTATPPYDALGTEWSRYEELCGPVDEEISVPELVRSGTLCPHQDYVMAVSPTAEERLAVEAYDVAVAATLAGLLDSPELLTTVRTHPWLQATDADAPLEHPELAVTLLSYLRACGVEAPPALLRLLGARPEDIPPLDRRRWQILIHHYLFGRTWAASDDREAHRDALARQLRSEGLLWRRELYLEASRPVATHLMMSAAKVQACVDIHRLEADQRGDRLRQVILTDYIRSGESERVGAWPIFARLVASLPADQAERVALLTGRVAALHCSRIPELRRRAETAGLTVESKKLEGLAGFVELRVAGQSSGEVALLTDLLSGGDVRVLVGTRGLLGQGWDAPPVNSLVLASYVGAYVGTNQMRGRAIRSDPSDPEKTASIWHLVAFHGTSPAGLADWESLERRFDTFTGLAHGAPLIESGLARLALPHPRGGATPESIGRTSADRLPQVHDLRARWQEAVERGGAARVVPSLRVQRPPKPPAVLFRNTIRYLLITAASAGFLVFTKVLEGVGQSVPPGGRTILAAVGIAALVGLVVASPMLIRAAISWMRVLPVDGALREIAHVVRDSLVDTGQVTTPPRQLELVVDESGKGQFVVALRGATFLEQSIFADSLHEVIGPIQNPRYLVTRGSGRRADIHAVPQLLGRRKADAEIFQRHWTRRLGPASLIYTRNPEGRQFLLQARARSFSATFVPSADRLDRWA